MEPFPINFVTTQLHQDGVLLRSILQFLELLELPAHTKVSLLDKYRRDDIRELIRNGLIEWAGRWEDDGSVAELQEKLSHGGFVRAASKEDFYRC